MATQPNPVNDAWLKLVHTPGIGPVTIRRLIDDCGDVITAAEATTHQLKLIEGIGPTRAAAIRGAMDQIDLAPIYDAMAGHNVDLLTLDDPAYPKPLKLIHDPPPVLFVRGRLEATDGLAIAVVGSRKCTNYGREQADRLASMCAGAGLTIVSGGAYGIDTAAHRAAVRINGRTIVVTGCGLDCCYPPENAELFDTIARHHGALVSEFPIGTPPKAEHFPRRNRIISGMSLGILVIEAARRSGALITARLAAEEHHREVMALPGRVDSTASAGCHQIIREGWGRLVTNAADILDDLGEAGQILKASIPNAPDEPEHPTDLTPANATGPADRVLAVLSKEPMDIEILAKRSNIDIGQIQGILTELQLFGKINRIGGNKVCRK